MILVDTSVMIDYLRGKNNLGVTLLSEVLQRDIPFGISPYTVQELLQGARDEQEFDMLYDYLSTQRIYYLPNEVDMYRKSARMFFDLRRKGITVRSSIDLLIALTAIENKLFLLHNDRDFDAISNASELRIYSGL